MHDSENMLEGFFRIFEPAPIRVPRTETPPQQPCCAKNETKTQRACVLCTRLACNHCRGLYNGQWICPPCRTYLLAFMEAEQARGPHLWWGLAGGLVAAMLAAVLWATVAISAGLISALLILGVGLLSGFGVYLGALKKRGVALQCIAICCAVLGILLGRYAICVHAYFESLAPAGSAGASAASYLDPSLLVYFFSNLNLFLGPLDLLFCIVAIGAAWLVPRPRVIAIR